MVNIMEVKKIVKVKVIPKNYGVKKPAKHPKNDGEALREVIDWLSGPKNDGGKEARQTSKE